MSILNPLAIPLMSQLSATFACREFGEFINSVSIGVHGEASTSMFLVLGVDFYLLSKVFCLEG